MATYTVQNISLPSPALTPAYVSAAASDVFPNDGKTFLHVKNAGGSPDSVVVNSVTPCDQGADHDVTVSVTNAQERMIGPFPPARFNDANGNVTVTHSFLTSVTVAALRLP